MLFLKVRRMKKMRKKRLTCEYIKYAPNAKGKLEVMFKGGSREL